MNALFIHELNEILKDSIYQFKPIYGGDINQAAQIYCKIQGQLFIKYHQNAPDNMFELEFLGLNQLIHAKTSLHIPKPFLFGKTLSGISYLIMEFIETQSFTRFGFEKLGLGLAELHRIQRQEYGLDSPNFIGSLPQDNTWKSTFAEFFWENRILPQLKLAMEKNYFSLSEVNSIEKASKKWESIFPDEKASLIHGDLWAGNIFFGVDSVAGFWDPSVSFSHREMEIAFTSLFGGFPDSFYHAYETNFPLKPAFHQRKALYQLYPVLVHVNLFGGSYVSQAKAILNRYV